MAYDARLVKDSATSLARQAGSWTGMALQMSVNYIRTVGINNPPEKVVRRPDVQDALTHSLSAARIKVMALVDDAWAQGLDYGDRLAQHAVKGLRVSVPTNVSTSYATLARIHADVERILAEAHSDMLRSYEEGGDDALVKAQKRCAYRVFLAVEAALKHAQAERQHASLSGTDTLKKWVTHSLLPCSHCVFLASLPPIPWEQEYPTYVPGLPILRVYSEKFLGPPRHPNCACTLVAVKR